MPRPKRNQTAAIAIAVLIALARSIDTSPALAQAGSVGGTIGNANKSVSGEELTPSHHHVRQLGRRGERHRTARQGGSACTKFIGLWKGALGGDMVFKPDGTVVGVQPTDSGSWSCKDEQLNVTWRSSEIDSCALSADGASQTCKNTFGYSFIRTRESGSLVLP